MNNVVITGSTKGIGLGLAKEFLKSSCTVFISGRNKDRLEHELIDLKKSFGKGKVAGGQCDVSDYAQVSLLWDTAVQKFGSVDIWINNAGIDNSILPYWELDSSEIGPVVPSIWKSWLTSKRLISAIKSDIGISTTCQFPSRTNP